MHAAAPRQVPLNALRAFEAAARLLSFTRAGNELHVTPAAVSHQVKELESRLGIRLFERLPRNLRLTQAGRALLPEVREGLARLAKAVERAGTLEASGRLTVSSITTFALSWLIPRMARFVARAPDVYVSVVTTLQLTDFGREDVDVAIRYSRGRWPDLRCDRLFEDLVTPLCSPALAERLQVPGDLAKVPLLLLNNNEEDWSEWIRAAGTPAVDMTRGVAFDSTALAIHAAIAGIGVAIGNPNVHSGPISDGRLVQPFTIVAANGRAYWLVCPERSAEQPKIKAFREWILDEATSAV